MIPKCISIQVREAGPCNHKMSFPESIMMLIAVAHILVDWVNFHKSIKISVVERLG